MKTWKKKSLVIEVIFILVITPFMTESSKGTEPKESDRYNIENSIENRNVRLSHLQEEWEKTFGREGCDVARDGMQTSDGGYVLGGMTQSDPQKYVYDIWIVKTDGQGNKEWEKIYGSSEDDMLFNVQQTIDEGYIMAALIDYDCCLIKISENGEIEWEKEYNVIFFVQQTDDGGYIMTGQRGGDLCIIKTDAVGEEEWEKTYPVNGWESAGVKLQQTQDKGYIVLGAQWNDEKTYPRLIKTDEEGNIEWEKVFEEEVSGDILGGYALDQTSDGFIIAYYLSSSDMGKLIKRKYLPKYLFHNNL